MNNAGLRVLYVVTGNKGRLSFVFANQLRTLEPYLADYKVFLVKGKGVAGYLSNLKSLKRTIRDFQPDLIHAHYSLCGYLASMTLYRPVLVSLMGSDCRNRISVLLIRLFHGLNWAFTIVKSNEMMKILKLRYRVQLIPNGVDLSSFRALDKDEARRGLGFLPSEKYVLFIANPARPEKNYKLAQNVVAMLPPPGAILHTVFETPHEKINLYLRAADALLLTSTHEGSPNVVKEAMACGLPVVATDVGDIRENIDKLPGCHVCRADANELAVALQDALSFKGPTTGLERILEKGLDAGSTAARIIDVYKLLASAERQ
ncbi:MAG TPA: glycosyltransferase [Candidatus Syntrophosphaera sp.]|nr:glycosyltransferase [Candidatus Cloacimonadota bacterium]HOR02701.1 glycosyltransferase [Candidatus Syntrophosphaera sp.]